MSSALRSSVSYPSPVPAEKRQAVRTHALMLVSYVALFVAAALDVTHGGVLADVDPRIARWSAERVPDWGHALARTATHLGDAGLLAAVTLLAAAWLVHTQQRLAAGVLVAAAATTGILTFFLKLAFRRPRPLFVDAAGEPHSFSFPSGHASGVFAVYVLAALLLTAGLSGRRRMTVLSAALALATMVATTRVVMPVHYLTDVIAGGAVGLSLVAAALLVRAAAGHGR